MIFKSFKIMFRIRIVKIMALFLLIIENLQERKLNYLEKKKKKN